MATPLSIRFSPPLLDRLRHRAHAMTGASVAGLAQRLIDEVLRMADHPGIIFKDGPSGRRAALAYGPDVCEVIKFLREVDERGPAAIDAAAEVFAVDASRISTADQLLRRLLGRDRRRDRRSRRRLRTRRGRMARSATAHRMSQRHARLLLDEMFAPAIAAELGEFGHDVIAVADRPDLRSNPTRIYSPGRTQKSGGCSSRTSRTSARACWGHCRPKRPLAVCSSPAVAPSRDRGRTQAPSSMR